MFLSCKNIKSMATDDSASSTSSEDGSELPLKEIKGNSNPQELFDIKAILNKVKSPLSSKPEIPTKSSTEILSELFGALNAEPPKIPDVVVKNSDTKPEKDSTKPEKSSVSKKSKKSKKKHKHKDKKHKKSKHKKHSKRDESVSDSTNHKRKHKHSNEHKKRKVPRHNNADVSEVPALESSNKTDNILVTLPDNSVKAVIDSNTEDKQTLDFSPSLPIDKTSVDRPNENFVKVGSNMLGIEAEDKDLSSVTELDNKTKECFSSDSLKYNNLEERSTNLVQAIDAGGENLESSGVGTMKVETEVKKSATCEVETNKPLLSGKHTSERGKNTTGKITIKNLKFSSVYEETVRQVEEQARLKAEKYEEGEISDSSANPSPSDVSAEDLDVADDCVLKKIVSVVPDTENVPFAGVPDDLNADEKNKNILSHSIVVEVPNKKSHKSNKSTKHTHRSSSESRSRSRDRTKKRSHSKSRNKKKRSRSKEKEPRHRSKERNSSKRKDDSHNDDQKRSRSKDKHGSSNKSNRSRDSSLHRSETNEGHKSRQRGRSHENNRHRSRSRDSHHSWKRDRSRDSSHHRRNPTSNSKNERTRGRTRSRSRHRSRSRSRSSNRIDKQKLLEIARKNAMALLKQGALPSSVASQEKVVAIKAGGKSVAELTDFCKQLSKKEAMGSVSSDSDGEERRHSSDSENERPFHHPFQIKERPSSIVLNIRNSVQLPVKTLQEKTAEQSKQLRIQFPVSSGQQHRKSEKEWIPVSPKKEETLAVARIPEPRALPHHVPKGEVFPTAVNTEAMKGV